LPRGITFSKSRILSFHFQIVKLHAFKLRRQKLTIPFLGIYSKETIRNGLNSSKDGHSSIDDNDKDLDKT
jgi:hypothetical protein